LLLEYSLGEDRSYVFAVTPDSLQAFELPKRTEVETAARRVYSLLTARNLTVKGETPLQRQARLAKAQADYPHAAAELSKMVLGPVASQLQNKRLLIVSDGALAYIPFSTLPEPADTDGAISATAEPLVVNHEIVNLPSASVLAVLRQQELGRKPAPNAVAVMADPVFDRSDSRVAATRKMFTASAHAIPQTRGGQISANKKEATKNPSEDPLLEAPTSAGLLTRSATDIGLSRNGELSLPRLRFTRKEADEIMAVTPAGMGKKAVDFDATRAMATSPELSQYRIVHFATHGLLDSAHPELSGLVFSMVDKTGRPQNGFLELQDIYNLNLPADLVVLSACETGLGKEISGEGLVGLTRGFMYAGASRVVASLWRVSDVGTAELMGAFYAAMEKDGLPPAAALRAAQIKLWKQKRWSDPYYWAAFQIQGEWK
jgi:CHAT domain-containing protein